MTSHETLPKLTNVGMIGCDEICAFSPTIALAGSDSQRVDKKIKGEAAQPPSNHSEATSRVNRHSILSLMQSRWQSAGSGGHHLEIDFRASVHLTLQHFEFVDLPFGLSVLHGWTIAA